MRLFVVSVIFFVLQVAAPFTSLASKHGCASPVPPPVSGNVVQPSAAYHLIYMNEVLLAPHSTWNCSESGIYSPTNDAWVELYNPQNQAFDLSAVHAVLDSGPNTNAFYFPLNAVIPPDGFLVVFPRTDAPFLATETSTLRLLISGLVIDQVKIPQLAEDTSYARIPDGSDTWQISTTPTIDASNTLQAASGTTSTHHHTRTTGQHTSTLKGRGDGSSGGWSGTSDSGSYGPGVDGSGSGGDSSTANGSAHGVQPTWGNMQFPNRAAPAAHSSSDVKSTIQAAISSAGGNADVVRKILLTVFAVALAIALFWCWQLFAARKS